MSYRAAYGHPNRQLEPVSTFDTLIFHNVGHDARGCKARSKLNNNLWVEVYGGFKNTISDGVTTFDCRVLNKHGETVRVPGYPNVLRCASRDDITCMLIHCQRHVRMPLPNRKKVNIIKS